MQGPTLHASFEYWHIYMHMLAQAQTLFLLMQSAKLHFFIKHFLISPILREGSILSINQFIYLFIYQFWLPHKGRLDMWFQFQT